MGYYLALPIAFLIYLVFLLFTFDVKNYESNLENRYFLIFSKLSIFGLIVDISSIILDHSSFDRSSILMILVNKLSIAYLFMWISAFSHYLYIVLLKRNYQKNNIKRFYTEMIIFSIFLLFIPYEGAIDNPPSILINFSKTALYSFAFSLISFYIINIIKLLYIDKKQNKNNYQKYLQVMMIVFTCILACLMQIIFPKFYIFPSFHVILCYIFYFSIENPDLKALNEIENANKVAKKVSNEKNKFLETMSHKIRSPLSGIKGLAEILSEEPNLPIDASNNINDIITASDNLIEIIDGILNVTKVATGKIDIYNKDYSLKKILHDLNVIIKTRINSKPITLKCEFSENIPDVLYGDSLRMKQVILNLLTNACKYTDKGTINFSVSAKNDNKICHLTITVEDTGRGIKEENIEKLFTKFERLDEEGSKIEGTGLGLAITKKLIDLMNGTISVNSVYKKGSIFTITIDQPIISMKKQVKEKQQINEILSFNGKKVLLIDDDEFICKVIKKKLEKYDLDVKCITNSSESLSVIKNNKFDLILIDDLMPNITGKEILVKLKKIEDFKTPVIMVTATAIIGSREKYLRFGFNDYISKPIENSDLINVLKKFL